MRKITQLITALDDSIYGDMIGCVCLVAIVITMLWLVPVLA
jgi:hypothetical protein